MASVNNSTSATPAEVISQHDKQIVDLIFNSGNELTLDALLSPASGTNKETSTVESNDAATPVTTEQESTIPSEQLAQLKSLEVEAVYRLMNDNDRAFEDLDSAIKHAGSDTAVLRQAYTQRGIIHKARGDTDAAFRDFERGGRLGSDIAKEAAVHENPYAKMCNAIVMEAMNKLRTPQQ
ncbi:hypothetical protein BDF22DRAFT_693820 [Syncephalis plumigaleata]|nr:hypothetical protein BDF22DRAFT_693820 [Syncephalis plumigaleata]